MQGGWALPSAGRKGRSLPSPPKSLPSPPKTCSAGHLGTDRAAGRRPVSSSSRTSFLRHSQLHWTWPPSAGFAPEVSPRGDCFSPPAFSGHSLPPQRSLWPPEPVTRSGGWCLTNQSRWPHWWELKTIEPGGRKLRFRTRQTQFVSQLCPSVAMAPSDHDPVFLQLCSFICKMGGSDSSWWGRNPTVLEVPAQYLAYIKSSSIVVIELQLFLTRISH